MNPHLCATPGCERPQRWQSITEGNVLGSKAPRRCAQCCDAIGEAVQTLLDGKRLVPIEGVTA